MLVCQPIALVMNLIGRNQPYLQELSTLTDHHSRPCKNPHLQLEPLGRRLYQDPKC